MMKAADLQPPDLDLKTGCPLWSTAPSTVSNSSSGVSMSDSEMAFAFLIFFFFFPRSLFSICGRLHWQAYSSLLSFFFYFYFYFLFIFYFFIFFIFFSFFLLIKIRNHILEHILHSFIFFWDRKR